MTKRQGPGRLSRRAIVATGAALLFAFGSRRKAQALESEPSRTPTRRAELNVSTSGDLLEFSPKELKCPAKSRVRLSFTNAAKYVHFEHNWVLIRPGSYDAVVAAAERAGEDHGWVPQGHPGIIAATATAHAGETVGVEFDAPAPGKYLYLCTLPGHSASMWGVLLVTET
jgi:azurin